MAEKDRDNDEGPSLELPSFSWGRKGRTGRQTAAAPTEREPVQVPAPAPEPPAPAKPAAPAKPVPTAEPVAVPATAPVVVPATVPATAPVVVPEPVPAAEPVALLDANEPAPEKHRRDFSLPVLSGMVAAVVTGAVIGLLAVVTTSVTLRGCEAVRGTSSCGGAGLFLLLAILIGLVYVGGFLLRAWDVPDPGSTSFLAVGLVAVVALLFLIDALFSWTMIIVIPVVGMGAFALSHWVTTAFIEPADD